jgi:hypothetical protein
MPRPRHEPLKIAACRAEAVRLYDRRWTQAEIAALLGVDQATVSRDLTAAPEGWAARNEHNLTLYKNRELARLDAMEQPYWPAWRRSMRKHKATTQAKGGDRRRQG